MSDSIRAAFITAVNSALVCVVAFGVHLTDNQIGAIMGAVNGALFFAVALEAAWKHQPAAPAAK